MAEAIEKSLLELDFAALRQRLRHPELSRCRPHFRTREEFRHFVQAAHEQGIYVILVVVVHHTGNVFDCPTRPPT